MAKKNAPNAPNTLIIALNVAQQKPAQNAQKPYLTSLMVNVIVN